MKSRMKELKKLSGTKLKFRNVFFCVDVLECCVLGFIAVVVIVMGWRGGVVVLVF